MIRKVLRGTVFFAAIICCFLGTSLVAQISNGTIRGAVTDKTGAILPDATITLVKVETGEAFTDLSNKEGYYTFAALSPGEYEVKVSAAGFSPFEGKLTLRVAQEAVINASLNPGSVTATVAVNDVTPIIHDGDGTISDVKDVTRIDTLPVQSSNFLNLLNFSPGVVAGGYAGQGGGYTRVNGITGGSMTFQVDGGSANDRFTNDLQATPQALQTVQELKITTSNGSAEFGTPGVVDVVTKGGTNNLHGAVHELYQNGGYEAKSFLQQSSEPHLVHNEFGGQIGGPVYLPKLYNGKNKTFFYFDVEQQLQHSFASDYELLPQTDWTQGDFSDYVDGYGKPVKIYDPLTTALDPVTGNYVRQQFPGNKIPAGRINPIAAKVMTHLPAPNINCSSGGACDPSVWNYGVNWEDPAASSVNSIRRYTGKVDQLLGKNTLSARYTYTNQTQLAPAFGGSSGTILNPQARDYGGHNGVLSFTEPIGSRAVNEVRVGVQLFNAYSGPVPLPGLIASLGLPVYPDSIAWPGMYWDDDNNFAMAGIDRPNPKSAPNQNVTLGDNFSLTMGKHEMKMGFQVVNSRLNTVETQNPGGNYNFSGVYTALQDPSQPISAGVPLTDTGAGLADFLLGQTDLSFLELVPILHTRQTDYDGYFQDNWKLSPHLTLNLGLRYEYWSPFTDAGGLSATLNFNTNTSGTCTVPSDISGGAAQPCVAAGAAGYPAWFSQSQPSVVIPNSGKGQNANTLAANEAAGLPVQTATQAGFPSQLWNMSKTNIAPRLGFAYLLNDHTVIRGGYGIYYWTMPLVQYHQNTRDNAPWTYSASNFADDNYPNCSYDGPCPSELTYPVGPASFPSQAIGSRTLGQTFINTNQDSVSSNGGWNIAPWDKNFKPQRVQEYNITFERALPGNWAFVLGYIGNHGDHLVDYDPVNALLPRALTPGQNPSTAARRPLPIFANSSTSAMDEFKFIGYSNHNELRAEANHTFKGSFTFQSYFTWAKTLTTSEGTLNSFGGLELFPAVLTNNASESQRLRDIYAPDSYLPAKSFGANGHYELPIGKGRRFLSSTNTLVNEVASGWNTSIFYLWRGGLPFSPYYQAQPSGAASKIELAPGAANRGILPDGQRKASEWFNASIWDPGSGTAYAGQTFQVRDNPLDQDFLNNIPRNYMTGPGFWNSDGTLYKLTPLGEHATLDLELQVFNIFNHINLGQPNTGGVITAGIGTPRLLQLQGKITF